MALVDYKTARDLDVKDIDAFQLAIYAAAARGEGINIWAAYVHDLGKGDRLPIAVDDRHTLDAKYRANRLVNRIISADYTPAPERRKCRGCDMRFVCRHGSAR